MEKQTAAPLGAKATLLVLAGILLGSYAAVKWLGFVVFPLGLGWLLAYWLQGPIALLHRRLRLPPSLGAALLVALSLALVLAVLVLGGYQLFREAHGVGQGLAQAVRTVLELADGALAWLEGLFGVGPQGLRDQLPQLAMGMVEQAAGCLPALVAALVQAVPQVLIGAVLFGLAAFTLSARFSRVNRQVLDCFDPAVAGVIRQCKQQLLLTVGNYLKAYVLLFMLSFTQLYFGLTVLGVPYAFTVGLVIALVDILPLLGMGIVVIPWALWCVVNAQYSLAVGLGILLVAMSVIRQVTEPRVVGGFIGLHPLASLLAVCVGLRFYGVIGVFLLPMLWTVIRNLFQTGYLSLGGRDKYDQTTK